MKIWEEIKKQIKLETKWYFEPKEIDTDPLVDTLKKIFNTAIDSKYSLGGLATTYTNALFKVIDEDSSKKDRIANFEVLKNVEPFLKKILYFKDFEKFLIIKDEMKGLTPILKSCGLNPSNIYMDEEHLKSFTEDQYEYHLTKTFILRNLESHNCELWSSRELEENIGTELIFYMEAVNRCHDAIALKLSEVKTDYTTYIENEITEFEKWASRFVATDTIEDFSVFESYAVEHIISYDESEEDNDDEIVKERSGTVDWIRKNNLPERRMILWGDAGLGKSTTLQYLTYLDARAYRKGISNIIPVYIPLGMLIDRYETLESYIFSRLKTEVEEGKKLLESGKINLFLDGVNEIPEDKSSDILSKRIKEIQLLIDSYPKTLMIISNRPEKYNQFRNIPVFRLQPMDYVKIMEFIQKNTRSEEVRNLIKEKIESNKRLLNIISTPLMTTRLISIVQEFKKVPDSEGMIIKQFLDTLYKREIVDKQDSKFNVDKINYLLTSLALYGFKKNGTNSGLTRYEVLTCFSKCLEELHFEYDTLYALDILIKIGVLTYDSAAEIVVFAHQAYQDFYLSKADSSNLLSKDDDIINKTNGFSDNNAEVHEQLSGFYEITANDTRYNKSTLYKIQLSDENKRNEEIKLLSKYNIRLAAQSIPAENNTEDIKQHILKVSDDYINYIRTVKDFSKKMKRRIIDCLWVDYELNNKVLFKSHIMTLLNADENKRKCVLEFISETNDSDSIIKVIKYISSLNNSMLIRDLYDNIIDILYLKDISFKWTEKNIKFIEGLSKFYLSCSNGYGDNFKFVLTFNVPNELINFNIFEKIRIHDFTSIRTLLDSLSMKESCEFIKIILKAKEIEDEDKLIASITNSLMRKNLTENDYILYHEIINKLLEKKCNSSKSMLNIMRLLLQLHASKEYISETLLKSIENFIKNPENIKLRKKNEQLYSSFVEKYFPSTSFPSILDSINELNLNSNINIENITRNLIEGCLLEENIIDALNICENNPRYISLLFIYLPIKITYEIVKEHNYFYFEKSMVLNQDCIIKIKSINWNNYINELKSLYGNKVEPINGILVGHSIKSFLYKQFIRKEKDNLHTFNDFFISIPEQIQIHLIEFRDLKYPKENIFKLLTNNYQNHFLIDNRIYIPLDNEGLVFLECLEENKKLTAFSIIVK